MCAGVRSIDELASSTVLLINHTVLLIRIRKIFERRQVSFHFSGLKKINTRGFRVKQKKNGHKKMISAALSKISLHRVDAKKSITLENNKRQKQKYRNKKN